MTGPLPLTAPGTAYFGATQTACVAGLGFDVLGVDTDARKVDQLNAPWRPAGWTFRALGVALPPSISTRFAGRRSIEGRGHGASR
jgi:hypothetical protein